MMSRTQTLSDDLRRPWRPRITLAHLGLSILGMAILFGVVRPLLGSRLDSLDAVVSVAGRIDGRMAALADYLSQVAVVLALARHVWRGGYPRPAEWLAMALLLSRPGYGVTSPIYTAFLGGLHALTAHPIEIGSVIYAPRASTISLSFTLIGCLAFAATRRVLPSRARTPIVFILALLLVWGAIPSFVAEFLPMLESFAITGLRLPQQAASTGCLALFQTVFAFVVALPAVAAIRDYFRRDRPAWSLAETLGAAAGLVMALGWLIGVLALIVARGLNAIQGIPIGFGPPQFLDPGTRAAAFVIAWIVARHYGTAWTDWLNAEPDGAGSCPTDPAVSPPESA